MTKKLHAIFDGEVFRPEEPVDLEVNRHYLLNIEPLEKVKHIDNMEDDPALNISSLAVRTGIDDLATEHDHYLYGISKKGSEKGSENEQ